MNISSFPQPYFWTKFLATLNLKQGRLFLLLHTIVSMLLCTTTLKADRIASKKSYLQNYAQFVQFNVHLLGFVSSRMKSMQLVSPPHTVCHLLTANNWELKLKCAKLSWMLAGCSSSCGFQICSEKCQKLHIRHTAKECQYIKKIADKSADQWLTVLRVLMIRQEDSDLFDNFMLLEDHLQDRKDCLIMKNNKSGVFDVLKRYVPELLEGLNTEDIFRICGILDANSFRFDKNGSRGLFLGKSSLFLKQGLHCYCILQQRNFSLVLHLSILPHSDLSQILEMNRQKGQKECVLIFT